MAVAYCALATLRTTQRLLKNKHSRARGGAVHSITTGPYATQQFCASFDQLVGGPEAGSSEVREAHDRADPGQSARAEQSSKWAVIPAGTIPVYESAAYPTSLARRRPYSRSVIDPDFFS
jgi:hypothetical protein